MFAGHNVHAVVRMCMQRGQNVHAERSECACREGRLRMQRGQNVHAGGQNVLYIVLQDK